MGKHSIKNPDSFSDCIEMLVSNQEEQNYNFDILSERCFKMVICSNAKTWISTQLSTEESVNNIYINSGYRFELRKTNLLSLRDLDFISRIGAVFGPMEKSIFNQTVEDMYFLGGKHYIYLAGETEEFYILHDPDSSPYILIEKNLFLATVSNANIYCITLDEYCKKSVNYKEILKKYLSDKTHLEIKDTPLLFNKGIGGLASYKYGLRLYLFYIKEMIDFLTLTETTKSLSLEIEHFLLFAAEGYQQCTWDYFLSITERGEQLIHHLAELYVH